VVITVLWKQYRHPHGGNSLQNR